MKISDCPDCDSIICQAHRAHLDKTLGTGNDSLPALYVELNLALTPGRAGTDDPIVTTSKTRRLPIASNIRAAQEHLLAVTVDVETWVRAELDWTPAPTRRGREGPTLQAACTVLRLCLDQWPDLPGARDQAVQLLKLPGQARAALGIASPRHNRIDLPCPECHTRTLRRVNGRDDIGCMYCAAIIPLRWLEQQLDMTTDRKAA